MKNSLVKMDHKLLVFQPFSNYITSFRNTSKIVAWQSKAMPEESITPPSTTDNIFGPE